MSSIANGAYREYNDKLVHAVKARPILYNSSLPEHKDRFLVELEWRQVAQAIGGTGEIQNNAITMEIHSVDLTFNQIF